MSRFLRTAAAAALTVAAFGAMATAASAQTYNRLVVFGDSLSDNGNLYAVTAGTQPPSPPYFQGRFSNGSVFTELLGFNAIRFTAGAPVTGSINYAFGGARTDNAASPPGMRNQLLAYTNAGGRFGPNDLVSVLGGANNIFQAFPVAAATPSTAQATMQSVASAAAADIGFIVNSVATAGAGTVLVSNLPNLALTPQFSASNPAVGVQGSALADFAGTSFNSALLTRLNTIAAAQANSNIILVDLYKIGAPLAANPGQFGLTNVTAPCFNGVTVCSNPDTYLYFDGVHPTAAGHRLLAQLATDYMYYGDRGAQSTVQGETAFRQREDAMDAMSEMLSGAAAWEEGGRMTFAVIGDRVDTDARGVVAEAEATGYGFRVGLDQTMASGLRFGLAGSFRQTEVEAGPMEFDVQSYGIDLYAGWRSGNWFANGVLGGAIDQYDDITRVTALTPVIHTAETDGGSVGGRVQAGVWFDMGGIALSPRAAINVGSTEVNGYVEQGPAAQYSYQDRTIDTTSGEVALRAEGGGDSLNFWIEGGYRDSFDDRSDAVRVGIAGNPADILSRTVDDPFGGSLLASAGLQADMMGGTFTVGYRGRFGDSADSHMGAIGFTLPLQ